MPARPEAGRRTPAEPGHPAPTGTHVRRRTGSGSPPGSSAVPQAADLRLGRCQYELGTPAALGDHTRRPPRTTSADRLHQRCHVTLLAGLLERRIQILYEAEDTRARRPGRHQRPPPRPRRARPRHHRAPGQPLVDRRSDGRDAPRRAGPARRRRRPPAPAHGRQPTWAVWAAAMPSTLIPARIGHDQGSCQWLSHQPRRTLGT
jgi:hypothetical protein